MKEWLEGKSLRGDFEVGSYEAVTVVGVPEGAAVAGLGAGVFEGATTRLRVRGIRRNDDFDPGSGKLCT